MLSSFPAIRHVYATVTPLRRPMHPQTIGVCRCDDYEVLMRDREAVARIAEYRRPHPLMSVAQASQYLRISATLLQTAIDSGRGPHGFDEMFDRAALDTWLDRTFLETVSRKVRGRRKR
mgnify:CR=1 FL=1